MLCKAAAAALPDLPFLYVRDFQAGKGENYKDAIKAIFKLRTEGNSLTAICDTLPAHETVRDILVRRDRARAGDTA